MKRAVCIGLVFGLVLFAAAGLAMAGCGGGCGGGPAGPCGEPCVEPCGPCNGCGGGLRDSCCIHPLAPVEWVLRLLGGSCGSGGCSGETYWGDECGNGQCSPCDASGNYVGAAQGRGFVGGYAGGTPAGNCGPNGCASRPRTGQYNGYAKRTPSGAGRPVNYGYSGYANRYPARGQAMPAAYQAGVQSDPNLPPPRIVSVTEQVVPQGQQVPQAATRPVAQPTR